MKMMIRKNKEALLFLFIVFALLGFASYCDAADTTDNSSLYNSYVIPKGNYDIIVNSPFSIQSQQESVSDSTGTLNIRQTDLSLPGRNGLDFNLTRIFSGQEANLVAPKASPQLTSGYIGTDKIEIYWCPNPPSFTGCEFYDGWYYEYFYLTQAEANARLNDDTPFWGGNLYHIYSQKKVTAASRYVYQNSTDKYTYSERKYNLGSGWSFAFPSLELINSEKYLHLPDGSVYRILPDNNKLEDYPFNNLTFATTTETIGGQTARYKLTSTIGQSVYFNTSGNWIGTKDAYGNQITVTYVSKPINGGNNYSVIDKIVDSTERTIQFGYSTNAVTVTYDGKTITYNKQAVTGETNEMVLSSFVNENGETTSYIYSKNTASFDLDTYDSMFPATTFSYVNLTTILYPTGSTSSYTYQKQTKNLGNSGIMDYYRVTERYDLVNNTKVNMIEYSYDANNFSGYPAKRTPESLPASFTYTNESRLISSPTSASPRPYSLKVTNKFSNKQLNTETTSLKESVYQSKQTRTFDAAKKLPLSVTSTSYDLSNNTNSSVTESYTYDSYGNTLTYTNPKGHVTTYTYSAAYPSLLTSKKTTVGTTQVENIEQSINTVKPQVDWNKINYYDENGQVQYIQTSYSYDSKGNIIQALTNLENGKQKKIDIEYTSATNYAYPYSVKTYATENGTLTTMEQRYEYDTFGRMTAYIDGNAVKAVSGGTVNANAKYNYTYDSIGRMTGITYPIVTGEPSRAAAEAVYVIDSVNQRMSAQVTDPEGNVTKTIYDGIGRPLIIQKQNSAGTLVDVQTLHYNALGQLDYGMDGNSKTTSYEYDAVGRKTKTIFDDNSTIQTFYDDVNRKVTTIDQRGNMQVTYVDELGRGVKNELIDVLNNKTITTTATYEFNGDPFQKRVVDANGNPTLYKNNGLSLLSQVTQWVGGVAQITKYQYNNHGLIAKKVFADSTTMEYAYDEMGRLISQKDALLNTETFRYDANDNMIQNKDKNGIASTFVIDERNRLTQQTKGTINTTYSYYKNNLRKTMADQTGTTQYTYWKDSSVKQITFPDGKNIQYEYDIAGNRSKMTDPFAQTINYTYDNLNRLKDLKVGNSSTKEAEYSYLPNGLVNTLKQANGMQTNYTYNGFNWLTGVTHIDEVNTEINTYSYSSYDNNGNLSTRTENGNTNTFTYNELNQILTNTQGSEAYDYDKRGNRLTLSTANNYLSTDGLEYNYDELNRLTQVKQNGMVVSTNTYNGDGLLAEQTENGVTTRYYYDGVNIIAEGTVAAGGTVSLKARYVRGAQLIYRENDTGMKGYYLHNGHGDVVELWGSTGNTPLNQYTYDIWGNPLTVSEDVSMPNPFRYSGELWDSASGLQYLRARWYDPSIGRFISEDAYKGDITNPLSFNLYTYVESNPLIYTDPTGHCKAGVDTGCYVDSFSGVDSQLNDSVRSTVALNSYYWKEDQWYKTNVCTDQACVDTWTGYQKKLEAQNDSIRNNACSYVDCMEGTASFTGNKTIQFTADGQTSNYVITPGGLFQCNCFTAGTTILTDKGEKPIEEIQIGDQVLAKNDKTGEVSYQEVELLFRKTVEETYNITVNGETITTTGEHPFWIVGKGWVKAKDLQIGEQLVTSDDAQLIIQDIKVKKENRTVYNFRVKNDHTYFVSNLKIWTHNADSCGSLLDGTANYQVYYGYNNKKIVYVGITNDFERRKGEHGDRFEKIEPAYGGTFFTKWQARGLEQYNIDAYGMQKNGGQLENKVNSISIYRTAIRMTTRMWAESFIKKINK